MKILANRVGVITGAAGGIGRALALELAREGMHVVLADVDEPGMALLAQEVGTLGRRCSIVRTDVRHIDQVEHLLERTLSEHGSCHLVINNAGVLHAAALLEAAPSQWQRVIDINLWGVLHGCRVFGQHFTKQREGHIVNVASIGGLFPVPGMTMYSTTKFAVVGFTQQLRWELAADGVGVTLVCPGLTKTGFFKGPEVGLDHLDVYLKYVMRAARGPEGLARKVRRAVQSDRPLVRYGNGAFLIRLVRLLPVWLIDPLGKRFAKVVLRMLHDKLPNPEQKQAADGRIGDEQKLL
jgi:NAD(P)-dependent dehydrogenase (short-subunit alcohol dehydrogenase family)